MNYNSCNVRCIAFLPNHGIRHDDDKVGYVHMEWEAILNVILERIFWDHVDRLFLEQVWVLRVINRVEVRRHIQYLERCTKWDRNCRDKKLSNK